MKTYWDLETEALPLEQVQKLMPEFEAGTFDKKIGEKLDALQGGEVSLAYKPGSKAGKFEIISIEPAGIPV